MAQAQTSVSVFVRRCAFVVRIIYEVSLIISIEAFLFCLSLFAAKCFENNAKSDRTNFWLCTMPAKDKRIGGKKAFQRAFCAFTCLVVLQFLSFKLKFKRNWLHRFKPLPYEWQTKQINNLANWRPLLMQWHTRIEKYLPKSLKHILAGKLPNFQMSNKSMIIIGKANPN